MIEFLKDIYQVFKKVVDVVEVDILVFFVLDCVGCCCIMVQCLVEVIMVEWECCFDVVKVQYEIVEDVGEYLEKVGCFLIIKMIVGGV